MQEIVIFFEGLDVTSMPDLQRARTGLSRFVQDNEDPCNMTFNIGVEQSLCRLTAFLVGVQTSKCEALVMLVLKVSL